MLSNIKRELTRHLTNYRGWRTNRKIVVIESDDWGSICMPSADTFKKQKSRGIRVDSCPYTNFDALASEKDLEDLFSLLTEFQDKNGKHPVITANAVMMNPDFESIRDSGFIDYIGEFFTDTLRRYPLHNRSFTLWKEGMNEKLFFPQFHGREHLNVKAWLNALKSQGSIAKTIFEDEMFWPGGAEEKSGGLSIRAAYDTDTSADMSEHRKIIRKGLEHFEKLLGFKSKSFIAPNFVYHPDLNETLAENGVEVIQGMKYQKLPMMGSEKRKMIRRYHGQINDQGQLNLVRNCVFEPSQQAESFDSVDDCIKSIGNAFNWRKPAIITAHRLNFIGYIVPENSERNLKQFRKLLSTMLQRWPDIEFMTSPELGDLIDNG